MKIFDWSSDAFLDVIRCDEDDYLVHKWSPNGKENTSSRENAIRFGSRLRVRAGEAAVFVYPQEDGKMFDYIPGPVDRTLHTDNFPVLSNIVGALFGGESPFIAEIYFFNLEGNLQIKWGIPYFDVFDKRFPDLGVPCAVRGTMTFNITDYGNFIKLYRLRGFSPEDFKEVIKDFFIRKTKAVILNIPDDTGLSVMQLERRIDDIGTYIQEKVGPELQQDFGANMKRVDIGAIELDKTHPHYQQLKHATVDQQTRYIDAKTGVEITNLEELARIQRKDVEYGVEGKHFAVHQLNQQADILKTAADNLGEMGNSTGNGGFNPVAMMAGMSIGNVMGGQMGSMMAGINGAPPPAPGAQYHIAINGQQAGPYTLPQLTEMAQTGNFSPEYYIWLQGMQGWEKADGRPDLKSVFENVTPPPPPPSGE